MLDFTSALSTVAYEVIMSERDHDAHARRWHRKLRELDERERSADQSRQAPEAKARELADTRL